MKLNGITVKPTLTLLAALLLATLTTLRAERPMAPGRGSQPAQRVEGDPGPVLGEEVAEPVPKWGSLKFLS